MQRAILAAQRGMLVAQRNIAASLKLQDFYNKPVVKEHIAALRSDTGTSCGRRTVLSYPTSRAVRLISPRFVGPEIGPTVICTIAIGDRYRDSVLPCIQSQIDFAALHGFAFCILDDAPERVERATPWLRIPLITKLLLQGYDRILYIDADAMITNKNFDVLRLFSRLENETKSILLTEDESGVNAGVMFIRNAEAALRVFDLIWLNNTDVDHPLLEQNSLAVLLDDSNEISSTFLFEGDPKTFNSFPVERGQFHLTQPRQIWSQGDFICHFSGIRTPHLERYIADYASRCEEHRKT